MPRITHKKGKELEKAVSLIIESILESDPKLKGTPFKIEVNKILTLAGARQEIDVFVQTLPGSQFEATHIFECKDWAKPVGTETVQVLAHKVAAIPANRGFLVAAVLTKDADNMLRADPKLNFIQCTHEFIAPLSRVSLRHTVHDPYGRRVSLKFRGIPSTNNPVTSDYRGKPCIFQNRHSDFLDLVEHWFEKSIREDPHANAVRYSKEGSHPYKLTHRFEFGPGEFLFDGSDVQYADIEGHYIVATEKLILRSKFTLKGRGSCVSFASGEAPKSGGSLEVDLILRI